MYFVINIKHKVIEFINICNGQDTVMLDGSSKVIESCVLLSFYKSFFNYVLLGMSKALSQSELLNYEEELKKLDDLQTMMLELDDKIKDSLLESELLNLDVVTMFDPEVGSCSAPSQSYLVMNLKLARSGFNLVQYRS